MQKAEQLLRRFRFGVFEANPGTGQLLKQGRRLRLQEQPFRLLAILLERPGELVTREELHGLLWPRTTVDFDHGLNKAVNKLRDALGDSAESPRFVETVARRGYRFLADVAVLEAEATPGVPAGIAPAGQPAAVVSGGQNPAASSPRYPAGRLGSPTRPLRASAWALAGLGLALLLAAASVIWLLYSSRPAEVVIRSLAVLPLVNLSGDPSQDYLADGITEELIAALGRVPGLRVISRQSVMMLKKAHEPLAYIARELNVDALVEGSVSRSGETIRIDGRLIVPPDGRQIWSSSYSGNLRDALSLQGRIVGAIAGQVQAVVHSDQPAPAFPPQAVNAYAYEVYLKARYLWNERTGDGRGKRSPLSTMRSSWIQPSPRLMRGWPTPTPWRATGSTASFLRKKHLPKPRRPRPRHWRWMTALPRPTPRSRSPSTSTAGSGRRPERNTSARSS